VVIPKAANPKHAVENATAADFQLTPEEVAAIAQAFPLPPGSFDDDMD